MTNLPTPLQAAVERLTLATKTYVPAASYRRGSNTENNDALAAHLRLILAALEERGKALKPFARMATRFVYLDGAEKVHLHTAKGTANPEIPNTVEDFRRALAALGETPDV